MFSRCALYTDTSVWHDPSIEPPNEHKKIPSMWKFCRSKFLSNEKMFSLLINENFRQLLKFISYSKKQNKTKQNLILFILLPNLILQNLVVNYHLVISYPQQCYFWINVTIDVIFMIMHMFFFIFWCRTDNGTSTIYINFYMLLLRVRNVWNL